MNEPTYEIEAETLTGDVRDVLLTHMRSMEVGWRFLTEQQQRDKIEASERCAEQLVRSAFALVSQADFPHITVEIGAVKLDGGMEIKLKCAGTVANVTRLAEHGRTAAILVLTDPQAFFGERDEAKPDKDQPSLLDQDEAA
jgi:hypothetical protein